MLPPSYRFPEIVRDQIVPVELTDLANASESYNKEAGEMKTSEPKRIDLSSATYLEADQLHVLRFKFYVADAKEISLAFSFLSEFYGSQVWVTNESGTEFQGPLEIEQDDHYCQTPHIFDSTVYIEIQSTSRIATGIEITKVFASKEEASLTALDWCHKSVLCPDAIGLEKLVRATVYFKVGETYGTGVLLNNTSGDESGYILTAEHHSINRIEAKAMCFRWLYHENCGGTVQSDYVEQIGAEKIAESDETDFLLLKLKKRIPTESKAYFSGWDVSGEVPNSAVGVYHPKLGRKAYARTEGDIVTSSYFDRRRRPKVFWKVSRWKVGNPVDGASGSGLWDHTGKLIGQLSGGAEICVKFPQHWYGKLAESIQLGTPGSKLKNALHPGEGDIPNALEGRELQGGDEKYFLRHTALDRGHLQLYAESLVLRKLQLDRTKESLKGVTQDPNAAHKIVVTYMTVKDLSEEFEIVAHDTEKELRFLVILPLLKSPKVYYLQEDQGGIKRVSTNSLEDSLKGLEI